MTLRVVDFPEWQASAAGARLTQVLGEDRAASPNSH